MLFLRDKIVDAVLTKVAAESRDLLFKCSKVNERFRGEWGW